MATTVRTITSSAEPVTYPDGTLYEGTLYWSLVNADEEQVGALDGTTYEMILPRRIAAPCASGVFSVDLWPTDRDADTRDLYYLCTFSSVPVRIVKALESSDLSDISFYDWANQE